MYTRYTYPDCINCIHIGKAQEIKLLCESDRSSVKKVYRKSCPSEKNKWHDDVRINPVGRIVTDVGPLPCAFGTVVVMIRAERGVKNLITKS